MNIMKLSINNNLGLNMESKLLKNRFYKKPWFEYTIYLILAGLFALFAYFAQKQESESLISIIYLPLAFIGDCLRALSLKSALGNGFAYVIYIFISLIPICVYIIFAIKQKKLGWNLALYITISAYLAFAIFFFTNPNLINDFFLNPDLPSSFSEIIKAGMAFILYFLILLAIMLLINIKITDNIDKIFIYIKIYIRAIMVMALFSAFFIHLFDLLQNVSNIVIANSHTRAINIAVYTICYLLRIIPLFAVFFTAAYGKSTLKYFHSDLFDRRNITRLKALSKLSFLIIISSIVCSIIINSIQLVSGKKLFSVLFVLDIPIVVIGLALIIMLISKILIVSIAAYEENQLTV